MKVAASMSVGRLAPKHSLDIDGIRAISPFAYCDEVWTGVEYQVAVCMVLEGMFDEALTIIKSIRDRYDGYKRCPWSETEAGHHYVRPMSSFSLIPAFAGFRCAC